MRESMTDLTAREWLNLQGLTEVAIDTVLRIHAQELAERQRAEADNLHQTIPGVVQGLRLGAQLIASEPSRDSTPVEEIEILAVFDTGRNIRNSLGRKAVSVPVEASGRGTVQLSITPEAASDLYRAVCEE